LNDLTIEKTIYIDSTVESNSKTNAQDLWKEYSIDSTVKLEDINETGTNVIFMKDLKKKKRSIRNMWRM